MGKKKVQWNELQEGQIIKSWLTGCERKVHKKYEDCVVLEEVNKYGIKNRYAVERQYIEGRWEVE